MNAVTNAEQPGSRVTVTTFNVWGLPSWLNGASPSRYRSIAEELTHLGSDVVLLQEVWTRRSLEELTCTSGSPNRLWWTASARKKGTFLGQNGLLTLSRYPISHAEVMHFHSGRLPDSLMHKGVLKVSIMLGTGEHYNVWNVHLQDGASGRIRSRQIAELIGWIQNSHDGQVADIVGGDFNCTPESDEFRQLIAGIGPDVHELAGDATFITWDGLKATPGCGQTLDYIFIRTCQPLEQIQARPKRIFAASDLRQRLSDHMGVEAALNFENRLEGSLPVLVQQGAATELMETQNLTSR